MSKVIVLDWGIFLHRAVHSSVNNPGVPATYTCMNMIFGNLFRIGVEPDDKIIIAVDGRNSWRKDYESEYKGDRKQKKKESRIDWDRQYPLFDNLLEQLEIATPWQIIKIHRLEADDIMAVCSRYFKDKEVILATYDSDLEQMWDYDNVKIFSPKSKKWKLKPKNFNTYKFISKKIQKEIADNLVSPILTEEDYHNRMICVNLLELPEWIEKAILEQLENYKERAYYPEAMPFPAIQSRYAKLYTDKSKLVDYQEQIDKENEKKVKALLKKKSKKKEAK